MTDKLATIGEAMSAGVTELARKHAVEAYVATVGHPACLFYTTRDADGAPSQKFRTLFLQELIKRGVLAPSLVASYSHDYAAIEKTLAAIDGALGVYSQALEHGVDGYLNGQAVQPVYRRYNRRAA